MKKKIFICCFFAVILIFACGCKDKSQKIETVIIQEPTKTPSPYELTNEEWQQALNSANYKYLNVTINYPDSYSSNTLYCSNGVISLAEEPSYNSKYTKIDENGNYWNLYYSSERATWEPTDESHCYVTPLNVRLEKIFSSPNGGTQKLADLKDYFIPTVFGNSVTYTSVDGDYVLYFTEKKLSYISYSNLRGTGSTRFRLYDYGNTILNVPES